MTISSLQIIAQNRISGEVWASRSEVIAQNGMAATSQPLATQVALDILKAGGNAVDAAIAANAMLGLVEPASCGIGGDLFAIIWDAKTQQLYGLNASGRSPMSLDVSHFHETGMEYIPYTGPLSVSVPGCIDGWNEMHQRFGKMDWKDLFTASIEYGRKGFPVSEVIAVETPRPALSDAPKQQVIGGQDADINDMPFMGAIVRNTDGDNTQQLCGCTAIDPFWVMTAAHCVDELRSLGSYKLVFGASDLANYSDGLVYYPQTVIIHPNYSILYDDFYSDIALIQLSTPLPPWITPVQLNDSDTLELPGTQATIAGWGRTSFDENDTTMLQSGEVSLISMEDSHLSDLSKGRVRGTLIPAGEEDPYTSTYSGDSGGPLMIFDEESNNWIQLGISSFGSGNKEENPISHFTRISSFKSWVDEIVQNDFLRWVGKNELPHLYHWDADPHTPLTEWMLDLDPNQKDAPDLLLQVEQGSSDGEPSIYLPLRIRNSVLKNFLTLSKSEDLENWETTTFSSMDWTMDDETDTDFSLYKIPILNGESASAFYRLDIEDSQGITHGPLSLRLGTYVSGHLGKAYNSTGIRPDGPTRYDFLLDSLSDEHAIDIFVQLYGNAKYNVEIYDFEKGTQIHAYTYGPNRYFSKSDFFAEENVQYLVRIEFLDGDRYVPFNLYADYSLDPNRSPKGTPIQGSLTHDDGHYIREGYYADRYTFNLAESVIYKVRLSSETLDPVIVAKWFRDELKIMEIDEESPGNDEELLFFDINGATAEIMAGSWRFEETGDYELQIDIYTDPAEAKPDDNFLGIIDNNDREIERVDGHAS